MTAARDELHRLVDALPDEQVTRAMAAVIRLTSDTPSKTLWPPPWIASIATDNGQISERIDEILAEGFGR